MCLRRANSVFRYSLEQRNVVYCAIEELNVKIELRMRLQPYSGAQSSYSSSYSVSTLLTKSCTFELPMLYYNTLLLHKIDKIKMVGTSRELLSVIKRIGSREGFFLVLTGMHAQSRPRRVLYNFFFFLFFLFVGTSIKDFAIFPPHQKKKKKKLIKTRIRTKVR